MESITRRITDYFRESYKELRKVIWPSWQQTLRYTLLVVGVSLALSLILGGFDILFSFLVKNLISIKQGAL